VDMKTQLFPGRMVSVDDGKSWWRVESNPHEVSGGWGWQPGLVIVLANRSETAVMIMEDEERDPEQDQQDPLEQEQEQEQGQEQEQQDSLVKQLRDEAAGKRVKAREAGELAEQRAAALLTALVKLDGRLADPSDLPYSEEYLTDEAAQIGRAHV